MLLDMFNTSGYKVTLYLIPKKLKWNEHVDSEFLVWSDSIYKDGLKYHYYNQNAVNYKNVMYNLSKTEQIESLSVYSKDGRLSNKVSYDFEENGDLHSVD